MGRVLDPLTRPPKTEAISLEDDLVSIIAKHT